MKKYTLIDSYDKQAVKDEDGDNVSFKASKDDPVVAWLYQKCFEINGCKQRGRFCIKIEDCK